MGPLLGAPRHIASEASEKRPVQAVAAVSMPILRDISNSAASAANDAERRRLRQAAADLPIIVATRQLIIARRRCPSWRSALSWREAATFDGDGIGSAVVMRHASMMFRIWRRRIAAIGMAYLRKCRRPFR